MPPVFRRFKRRAGSASGALALVVLLPSLLTASGAGAQEAREAPEAPEEAQARPRPEAPAAASLDPRPFGANLFTGAFAGQREDGMNPDYRILPGDRVMVNAWGAVAINDVFIVDTQGNIFLPGIGPVQLSGVRNEDLTSVVENAISRVYRGNFGVYTNLLTASPVAVFVTGGVERPGRYAGIPSDSVLFFLDQAGGIDPHAGSYRDIKIMREGQPVAELDLYDFLLDGTLSTPQFTDGDTILVGRRGPTVEVRGATPRPILVELEGEGSTGEQVLEVIRQDARTNEVTLRGIRDAQPVVETLPVAGFRAAPVRDGDVLFFREEGRPERILVRIDGEFIGPSLVSVERGTRLLDLLNWVPVEPEMAHVEAVHIRRDRVAEQQREAIEQSLDRLERSALLALSDSQGEAEIRVREAELVRAFVERARNTQPLGRVVTRSAGHQLNVRLQDGDTVVIPPRTNVVLVGGEVHMAQAVMYRPDLTIRDYVRMAGGYSNRADTGAAIVVSPSAEVRIDDLDVTIRPGDQIFIPPEIDNKVFQNAIDISQIIYQIAVAASVLIRI